MRLQTDKVVYAPGGQVRCTAEQLPSNAHELQFTLTHLNEEIWTATVPSTEAVFAFTLPNRDFTGYLLRADALNEKGGKLDTAFIGVDCASDWTKFPRYGYVWDFTENAPAAEKMEALSRFHINGVQYYDWQYRHHIPLGDDLNMWQDWSGRRIYGYVLRQYLSSAHEKGMVNMAYNMIYAANKTYLRDKSGVDPAWRLVKSSGEDFTISMSATRGSIGILQYFNPLNEGWQAYIFKRMNEVFNAFAFDGWHGDTIGENGKMTTPEGEPLGYAANGKPIYLVKDCYTQFLNAAKAAIGEHYLAFNPVGAQGIEHVNVSDVDVLYTEFWPWDSNDIGQQYTYYEAIQREIFKAAEQSGGKSLIVAGYINYRNKSAHFNPPAVLLMDAVCYASGGSRIELGNGANMLSDEYFPNDVKKTMDADLLRRVERMYDFIVAYENLLRDGQHETEAIARTPEIPCSAQGYGDRVWCFARENDQWLTIHLINLVGTDNEWRDTEQTKRVPALQKNVKVRVYPKTEVREAWLASPDGEDISPVSLDIARGQDEQGTFVEVLVPSLAYWDMIFLR